MTYWEQVAASRWGSYVTDTEKRAILVGEALAGPPDRALEIGCEGGRWSKLLWDRGWKMTCIDVDEAALEACQRNLPGANCILTQVTDVTIPCESDAYSLLLCIEVPPVIHSDWFFPEAQRVLSEGGVMIGVMWNRMSLRGLATGVRGALGRKPRMPVYRRRYREWRHGFSAHGFEVVKEVGFCWPPFGRTSNSRWIGVCARLERLIGLNRFIACSPWIVFVAQKRGGMLVQEAKNRAGIVASQGGRELQAR